MELKLHQWLIFSLFPLLFVSLLPRSSSQFTSPQNIETFFPFPLPPFGRSPSPPPPPPSPSPPLLPPSAPTNTSSSSGTGREVATAVALTAVSTLIISGILFFFLQRRARRKRKGKLNSNSLERNRVVPNNGFTRFEGNLKGLIVDEDGLDVLYWRKLEGGNVDSVFSKEVFNNRKNREEEKQEEEKKIEPIQEVPLLRGKSSTSHSHVWREDDSRGKQGSSVWGEDGNRGRQGSSVGVALMAVGKQGSSRSPPPTPPTPPPPPAVAPPPPPPPKGGGSGLAPKPPAGPRRAASESKQVKLKPLHWDKVNASNVDHSMVWDKIDGGSFRFDGDLMEALFGSVATNRISPKKSTNSSNSEPKTPKIFILDPKKSQNTAIVLRSIPISHKNIINALIEGKGLNSETLEKLSKIAPIEQEQSQITSFEGDPNTLSDPELFLHQLLKTVPSAFHRIDSMLFRSNYRSEIQNVKESIRAFELGCNELRARGLFMKLLEAVLKAGNRMNAGTSRGNAQAFDLNALQKLSDVRSTDRKTTLLNFVVEEVVKSEGKRCLTNRNRNRNQKFNHDDSISGNDLEKDYIMLGLPIVGGLSAEFPNLKKAATIDYDSFVKSCLAISEKLAEIRCFLDQIDDNRGGFVKEMKGFVDEAEEEVKEVREEQGRVIEIVKRTTEYYQAGGGLKNKGEKSVQLFVIVKDFLGMVDRVCVDIARNLQRRRSQGGGGSTAESPETRVSVRFPKLPANFMSDSSKGSSSDSGDDL